MPTPDLVANMRAEAVEQRDRLDQIVQAIDSAYPRPGRPTGGNGRRRRATRRRRTTTTSRKTRVTA